MSWKTNSKIDKAREEEALMREFEFMKKYGVDISSVPFGMAEMIEAACHSAYNRGWADCKKKVDVSDTNVGEWIPCSERLPEEEGTYFLTVETTSGIRWVKSGMLYSDEKFVSHGKVIAWMPLPEPYKVETK